MEQVRSSVLRMMPGEEGDVALVITSMLADQFGLKLPIEQQESACRQIGKELSVLKSREHQTHCVDLVSDGSTPDKISVVFSSVILSRIQEHKVAVLLKTWCHETARASTDPAPVKAENSAPRDHFMEVLLGEGLPSVYLGVMQNFAFYAYIHTGMVGEGVIGALSSPVDGAPDVIEAKKLEGTIRRIIKDRKLRQLLRNHITGSRASILDVLAKFADAAHTVYHNELAIEASR